MYHIWGDGKNIRREERWGEETSRERGVHTYTVWKKETKDEASEDTAEETSILREDVAMVNIVETRRTARVENLWHA